MRMGAPARLTGGHGGKQSSEAENRRTRVAAPMRERGAGGQPVLERAGGCAGRAGGQAAQGNRAHGSSRLASGVSSLVIR